MADLLPSTTLFLAAFCFAASLSYFGDADDAAALRRHHALVALRGLHLRHCADHLSERLAAAAVGGEVHLSAHFLGEDHTVAACGLQVGGVVLRLVFVVENRYSRRDDT